jgi:hypothetical protein
VNQPVFYFLRSLKHIPFYHSNILFLFRSFQLIHLSNLIYLITFELIISGVHLNFSSKLALKSRLWTYHSSVCRVKTQTTQKVGLDLSNWSVICNPWCVHNWLFNAYFVDKFKWTPDEILHCTSLFTLW